MKTIDQKLSEFQTWQKTLRAYAMALTLIGVDESSGAPREGAAYRADMRSVLAGEYQRVLSDARMYDLVCELNENKTALQDPTAAREVELTYELLAREHAIPPEIYSSYEKILFASRQAWPKARSENAFASYAPLLQEVIDGYREIVSLWSGASSSDSASDPSGSDAPSDTLYDRMLDRHQPGWDTARYDRFFGEIREKIPAILSELEGKGLLSGSENGAAPGDGSSGSAAFSIEKQREVMQKITAYLGFTESWGKYGESLHPLTSPVSKGDVRFTTRFLAHDPFQAVLSTVHECGHAWHAHGIDPRFDGSIIGRSVSAGLCESQSRLCENHLGRSLAFWEANAPLFQEAFPEQLGNASAEDIYRRIHTVRRSAIRTEADEVTYPLHILIRYELEKEMMKGSLRASDLEEAWNEKYRLYLGVTPRNAAEGVLQDMHWPYAYFGYFPTYALGSAFAAQFYYAMADALDLPSMLRGRQYPQIMAWLGEHIHRFGNLISADEILHTVTGKPFGTDDYFKWLEASYLS